MAPRSPRRGQILIPALLVFPSLFLFVLLLFDSGMLSREKIRRQFALDAAATIETDQYTDILNRIAYVNGAFPERVFKIGMGDYWQQAWSQGLFPADPSRAQGEEPSPKAADWNMEFGSARAGLNDPNLFHGPEHLDSTIHINPYESQANSLTESIQLQVMYMRNYTLIDHVAKQQWKIFEQTTLGKHSMVRESLRRNLCSEAASEYDPRCQLPVDKFADDEAQPFIQLRQKMHYVDVKVRSAVNHCPVWVTAPDGTVYAGILAGAIPALPTGQVFQVQTVDPGQIQAMEKQGWEIKHGWTPHPTYFKVEFPKQSGTPSGSGAFVYGRVTISGGKVWPHPTPKFFTRLNACRFGSTCSGQ